MHQGEADAVVPQGNREQQVNGSYRGLPGQVGRAFCIPAALVSECGVLLFQCRRDYANGE